MKDSIIQIVEDYLSLRKSGALKDNQFRERLKNIGLKSDKVEEILLKMDDEWTLEQITLLEIKEAKQKYFIGIGIAIALLIFSILSYFEFLFKGKIQLITFSVGALVSGMYGKSKLKSIQAIKKRSKLMWQSWLGEKQQKPFKIKQLRRK